MHLFNVAQLLQNLVLETQNPQDLSGFLPALQGLGDETGGHSPRGTKNLGPQTLQPGQQGLFPKPQASGVLTSLTTFSIASPLRGPPATPSPVKLALGAGDSPITVSWKCLLASPASLTATQE